ncbi:DUF2218 domain-containing protein [Radicibacter daui]|uniref:DUF2218 domain-containing protein n=1 Tax=Radicibacter daui TaxID=3064829 RepID=UPI0040470128
MHFAQLRAEADVTVAKAEHCFTALCDHMSEHAEVTRKDGKAKIRMPYGTAWIDLREGGLKLLARAEDETSLAFVKLGLAEHLLHFAGDPKPSIRWTGDGKSGGALPYFREMRVVSSRRITPRMQRVTLTGSDLQRFGEQGGLHIRLLIPPKGVAAPKWPVMGEDGRPVWPQGDDTLTLRTYTIRRIDVAGGEMDIDIVLHEGAATPGSDWGQNAVPGDVIGIVGPGGGNMPVADWYLLAGDETAIPAIARHLSRLPEGARGEVFIEIADAAEKQELPLPSGFRLTWLLRDGAAAGATQLIDEAIRKAAFPEGEENLFVWVAAEYASASAIRKYLRTERGLGRRQHQVAAYWRRGRQEGENTPDDGDKSHD